MVQGRVTGIPRDRDAAGRPRNARARDDLGRPLDVRSTTAPLEPEALAPNAALVAAQQRLDAQEPFAAHEIFESVWKTTAEEDRQLWRGLAQVAVGITHAARGNPTGARSLLSRGADLLAQYAGTTPDGVDVDGVRQWATRAADDLSLTTQPPRLKSED
jgi:hypothetical protein